MKTKTWDKKSWDCICPHWKAVLVVTYFQTIPKIRDFITKQATQAVVPKPLVAQVRQTARAALGQKQFSKYMFLILSKRVCKTHFSHFFAMRFQNSFFSHFFIFVKDVETCEKKRVENALSKNVKKCILNMWKKCETSVQKCIPNNLFEGPTFVVT